MFKERRGEIENSVNCYAVGFTLCISPGRTTITISRFKIFYLFSVLYGETVFKERRNVVVLAKSLR